LTLDRADQCRRVVGHGSGALRGMPAWRLAGQRQDIVPRPDAGQPAVLDEQRLCDARLAHCHDARPTRARSPSPAAAGPAVVLGAGARPAQQAAVGLPLKPQPVTKAGRTSATKVEPNRLRDADTGHLTRQIGWGSSGTTVHRSTTESARRAGCSKSPFATSRRAARADGRASIYWPILAAYRFNLHPRRAWSTGRRQERRPAWVPS
jgi:hypothetical protein